MRCVTSVSYSIKINGKPQGHIILSRGADRRTYYPIYFSIVCRRTFSLNKKDSGVWTCGRYSCLSRGSQIISFVLC